jgi:hypothetical protein
MHTRHRLRQALLPIFNSVYYRLLGGRWPQSRGSEPGYTIILPVAPEWYSVTEYNLRFLATCALDHCRRIIVIAHNGRYFHENSGVVRDYAARFGPHIDVSYFVLPHAVRFWLRLRQTPHNVHAANLVAAIAAASTTYVYVHDADFFLTDKDYLESAYNEMEADQLDALSPYPRFHPGITFPTPATYELMVRRQYLQRTSPSTLFAREIHRIWYSTFVRFFVLTKTARWRLRDVTGRDSLSMEDSSDLQGIHFKHMFDNLRSFQRNPSGFADKKFNIFLLTLLSESNSRTRRVVGGGVAGYLRTRSVCSGRYLDYFKRTLCEFVRQDEITPDERTVMVEALHKLEQKAGSSVTV